MCLPTEYCGTCPGGAGRSPPPNFSFQLSLQRLCARAGPGEPACLTLIRAPYSPPQKSFFISPLPPSSRFLLPHTPDNTQTTEISIACAHDHRFPPDLLSQNPHHTSRSPCQPVTYLLCAAQPSLARRIRLRIRIRNAIAPPPLLARPVANQSHTLAHLRAHLRDRFFRRHT